MVDNAVVQMVKGGLEALRVNGVKSFAAWQVRAALPELHSLSSQQVECALRRLQIQRYGVREKRGAAGSWKFTDKG